MCSVAGNIHFCLQVIWLKVLFVFMESCSWKTHIKTTCYCISFKCKNNFTLTSFPDNAVRLYTNVTSIKTSTLTLHGSRYGVWWFRATYLCSTPAAKDQNPACTYHYLKHRAGGGGGRGRRRGRGRREQHFSTL